MPKTNFFHSLESLQIKGTIQLALSMGVDRKWTGTIFVTPADIDDPAVQKIEPLTFSGTSDDLGAEFFDLLKAPIEAVKTLFTNMASFQKSVKTAESAAKMNQKKVQPTSGKQQPSKQDTKYQDKMNKVRELEDKERYGEAIAALPKASDFPDRKNEIEAKLNELKGKRGGYDLFDPSPTPESPVEQQPDPSDEEPSEEESDDDIPPPRDPFATTPLEEEYE